VQENAGIEPWTVAEFALAELPSTWLHFIHTKIDLGHISSTLEKTSGPIPDYISSLEECISSTSHHYRLHLILKGISHPY
jgi:hypothetical protein